MYVAKSDKLIRPWLLQANMFKNLMNIINIVKWFNIWHECKSYIFCNSVLYNVTQIDVLVCLATKLCTFVSQSSTAQFWHQTKLEEKLCYGHS